jgi:hypothetical protein
VQRSAGGAALLLHLTLLSQGVGTSRPSHMRGSRLAQAPPPSAPSTSSRTLWQNRMRR